MAVLHLSFMTYYEIVNLIIGSLTLVFLVKYTFATEKMKNEIIRQTDLQQSPVIILQVRNIQDLMADKADHYEQERYTQQYDTYLIRLRLSGGEKTNYYLSLKNVGGGTAFNVDVEKSNLETSIYESKFLAPNGGEQKFLMVNKGNNKIEELKDFEETPIIITCNDSGGKNYTFEYRIKNFESKCVEFVRKA
jgi:hypothetical protein